jgi:hypothetical protein
MISETFTGAPNLRLIAVGPALALATLGLRELQVTPLAGAGAFLLAFVLPGYLLTALLFGRTKTDGAERIVLVLALSIAGLIVLGLVLHLTPLNLTGTTWALSLAAGWVVGGRWLLRRGHALPDLPLPRLPTGSWLLFGAALAVLVAALILAREGFQAHPRPGFTELWLVETTANGEPMLEFGVRSAEHGEARYRLRLVADGAAPITWTLPPLGPGEGWTATWPRARLPEGAAVAVFLLPLDSDDGFFRYVSMAGESNLDRATGHGEAP